MGIFDNAKTVMIGNKEVQSIVTANGGVIYEKSSGYELILTSNKSIMQSGETATLTATLTNNNVPVEGELIYFEGIDETYSYSNNSTGTVENKNIGNYWRMSIAGNQLYVYIGSNGVSPSSGTLLILYDNLLTVYSNGTPLLSKNVVTPYFEYQNGILYYDNTSVDLSNYNLDMTNLQSVYYDGSITLSPCAVTNQNGVASVGYTGKGTGDLNIQAYDPERIISSEIYSVEDCLFADLTTSNQLSQYTITNYGSSFDTDHYVLSNTANYNLNFLKIPLTDLTGFIFEADMKVAIRGDLGNFGLMVTKASEISSSGITNNRTELMDYTTTFGMYVEGRTVTGHFIDNQYYTLRYTIKSDGTIKAEIIDTIDGRTVFNETVDGSNKISYLKECYIHSRAKTSTIHIKNIKVKPL